MRAFEGYEHAALGIYGLSWAQLLAHQDPAFRNRPVVLQTIDVMVRDFLDPTSARLATYGDLVSVVDYIETPDDCLPPYSLPDREYRETARRKAAAKLHSFRAWASSSHHNLDHFQRRAQRQYLNWHAVALNYAAQRDLWRALWVEAFADHFLQDSMVPGHVRTPRNLNLVDVAAVAMHDHFNRAGEIFTPFSNGRLPFPQLAALGQNLLSAESQLALHAGDPHLAAQELTAEEVSQLPATGFRAPLRLFGDGYLKRGPLDTAKVPDSSEKLLLITVTAASIKDLFDAYRAGALPEEPLLEPDNFEFSSHRPFEAHVDFGGLPHMAIAQPLEATTPFGEYVLHDQEFIPFASSLTLAIEANYQSLLAPATGSDRVELLGEVLTWGGASERETRETKQYGLLVGYSALLDRSGLRKGRLLAHGLAFKYVVPMPEVSSQFYTFGGVRWYRDASTRICRPYGGVGGEIGFSVCFLRLNLSAENYYRNGRWSVSPAVTFGIGGTITWNRMRLLFQRDD